MRVPEVDAASDGNLFLFLVVVAFLELGFFFEKQFVGGLVIAGKPERELSHFSTAAQSELFYTDSENDPAQIEKMPGAFKPPAPQRPCGIRAYKTPARPSWGLFHLRLASSPVSASA
jgi:hypothetical protein